MHAGNFTRVTHVLKLKFWALLSGYVNDLHGVHACKVAKNFLNRCVHFQQTTNFKYKPSGQKMRTEKGNSVLLYYSVT